MTTIKDVAKLANVSPSTVSRVLADSNRISQPTKERVRKAMEELDYYPNFLARSLITRASRTLGLVLSRPADSAFSNPFFPAILRGISQVTQSRQYNLLLVTTENPVEEEEQCLRMFSEKRVDGLILLTPRTNDLLIRSLTRVNCPFIVAGRATGKGCHSVNNDNIKAAYTAVSHLLSLGHRRIALLNGPESYTFCQDRYLGYCQALEDAGIPVESRLVRHGALTQEDGKKLTTLLLEQSPAPTAIFAVDDVMAFGVYKAASELGLTIPQDLSVVGFNDDPLASMVEPSLTTVKIPIMEMGNAAADMLIQLLEGGAPPPEFILASELVIRASCGKVL